MEKKYGIGRFLIDLFLTAVTGGLYLAYLVYKFIRTR